MNLIKLVCFIFNQVWDRIQPRSNCFSFGISTNVNAYVRPVRRSCWTTFTIPFNLKCTTNWMFGRVIVVIWLQPTQTGIYFVDEWDSTSSMLTAENNGIWNWVYFVQWWFVNPDSDIPDISLVSTKCGNRFPRPN